MVMIKSNAWRALAKVERRGLLAASVVTITIFRPRFVGGEKIEKVFMIGDALRTEKFESIKDLEDWLKKQSGSSGLKWGILYYVIDKITEVVGDFEIRDVMEVGV